MSNLPLPLPPPPLTTPAVKIGEKSLLDSLLSSTSAADTRNQEVTLLFQNIASVLDEAISENSCLPQHLNRPFREFIKDLKTVACRHFESYIRGLDRQPSPYYSMKTDTNKNIKPNSQVNQHKQNQVPTYILPKM